MENISRAIEEIARDNGAINRLEDEVSVMRRVFTALRSEFQLRDLTHVDCRLSELSDEDLIVLCSGEESEAKAIYQNGDFPFSAESIALIEAVLDTIFEHV